MNRLTKDKKRLLFLGLGIFLVCGIALGYAVLSQSIKINGTGTISTNWDILFTSIAEKSKKGATTNDSRITDKLTATFDVDLEAPGSYIEYNVKIRNNGNMDAVIAKVAGIVEANSADPTGIQFKVSGIRIGDDLLAGSETTFVVRAEIPSSEKSLPATSKTLDLKVDVRQKEVDSSGLVTTLNECFQTNEAGDTITGYLCGKGNTNGYSEILDVNIPGTINGHTITQIGTSAFSKKGLTSVAIPKTTTIIGAGAFSTNQLITFDIPDLVTKIGSEAFMNNQLKQLHLPDSLKSIGNYAFQNNQLSEIEIPSSVTFIGTAAFRMNAMPIEKAFIYNRNSDGTENKSSLNSCAMSRGSSIVIPDGIEIITDYACSGMKLQSIVLPETLKELRLFSFSDNEIQELVIPSSVTRFDQSFNNNKNLSSVEFKGSVPSIFSIGLFKGTSLAVPNTIKVPAGTLDQYKSASAKVIDTYASPSQTWFGSDDNRLLDAFYESVL